MKKTAVFALVLAIICVLTSCGSVNTEESTPISNTDATEESTPISSENGTSGSNLAFEPLPVLANSIEELKETIKEIKNSEASDPNHVSALDSLIVPSFVHGDYVLAKIEVTKFSLFYYYVPKSLSDERVMIDYDRDIVVTVRRSEHVNQEDPLQPLIDQLHLTPTEDGYLYDAYRREITFAFDTVWVGVRCPKAFTSYESIKELCKVQKINMD